MRWLALHSQAFEGCCSCDGQLDLLMVPGNAGSNKLQQSLQEGVCTTKA